MKLFDDFTDPEQDPGTWFVFSDAKRPEEIKDDERPAYLKEHPDALLCLVRRLPEKEDARIDRAFLGERSTYSYKGDERVVRLKRHKAAGMQVAKAAYCLKDTVNADIGAGDRERADFYASALGREVVIGEQVRLDGHWTKAVREHALREAIALRNFVLRCNDALNLQAEGEEEGKD